MELAGRAAVSDSSPPRQTNAPRDSTFGRASASGDGDSTTEARAATNTKPMNMGYSAFNRRQRQ